MAPVTSDVASDSATPYVGAPRPGEPPADDQGLSHTATARLRLVSDLARQVTARHDLGDVLQTTLAGLRRLVGFGGGSIQLLDDDGWIRLAAADPAPPEDVLAMRIPLGSSIGGRVILTEQPVYLADVLTEPVVADESQSPLRSRVSPGGVRSYFGVPLLADGHAIGLLQIDAPEIDAWDEYDRLLLLSVAPIVAAAIQNARAYARVAVLTANVRRDTERHDLVASIVDTEIDAALAALVALSEDSPLVRDQVDQLTTAIARIRGALGDTSSGQQTAAARRPGRQRNNSSDIDLRGNKTRT
jgi:GAF domain-containing protein